MAEFRGDVAPIDAPSGGRSVAPPPVSGETAQNLGRAFEGVGKIVNQYKKDALLGEETSLEKLPGIGEIPEEGVARQDLASKLQQDQLKTLNQIKTAREQGLISSSRARLLTNKAIRSQASQFPGVESTLRRTAGEFYGQFGPGEGLLEQTSSEAFAQAAMESMVKEGVKAGMIRPYDPMNDQEGISAWFNLNRKLTFAKGEQALLDSHLKSGQVGVDTYTNNYMASDVEPAVAGIVSKFIQMQQQGQRLTDPNDMLLRLRASEEQLVAKLNGALIQIPGASRKDIDTQIKAVRSRFDSLRTMAKDGSLSDFLTNKTELIQKTARLNMAHRLPNLFALETAFPKLGEELLRMGDRYAEMVPEQRKNYLSTLPPLMRESMGAVLESGDHFAFGPTVQRALESNVAPIDAFSRNYVDTFAIGAAKSGDPLDPEDKKSANSKSLDYVLKNIDSPLMADFLTKEPAVVARIKADPAKIALTKNRVRSGNVSIERQMQTELAGQGPRGDYFDSTGVPRGTLVYGEDGFSIKLNPDIEEEFMGQVEGNIFSDSGSGDEFERLKAGATPDFVKDLNRMNQIIDVFGPEMNINKEEWAQEQMDKFNRGIVEAQEQRAANPEKPSAPLTDQELRKKQREAVERLRKASPNPSKDINEFIKFLFDDDDK